MKPIASKIIKKLVRKSTTDKNKVAPSVQHNSQQIHANIQYSTQTLPLNLKSRRVHFKLVPSVQPAHLNIIPGESAKSANDRFSNLGDIVYYNI
jgi:hypothetical protein